MTARSASDRQPMTSLSSGTLATGHPVYLVIGSRVEFLWPSDQIALLMVGANPKW